jgi:hypothetical protein
VLSRPLRLTLILYAACFLVVIRSLSPTRHDFSSYHTVCRTSRIQASGFRGLYGNTRPEGGPDRLCPPLGMCSVLSTFRVLCLDYILLKTRTSLIYGITVLSFLFTHFSVHVSLLRAADGVTALHFPFYT